MGTRQPSIEIVQPLSIWQDSSKLSSEAPSHLHPQSQLAIMTSPTLLEPQSQHQLPIPLPPPQSVSWAPVQLLQVQLSLTPNGTISTSVTPSATSSRRV